MNKIYSSIIILLTSLFISSCNSKETPINNLDDLTEEIAENNEEYSDADWQDAALQYEQIEADLEEHRSEYSDEELQEIGKKKGKCLVFFAKHASKDFKENMKDAVNEVAGILEGFTEGLKE